MAKVKVAVFGSPLKTVYIDTGLGPRIDVLEEQISALEGAVSSSSTVTLAHSQLQGLQVGDDHPQYTMWQAAETITAAWNFAAEPFIDGELLSEFIEDVVGGGLVQDTDTIYWVYGDTAGTLEANVDTDHAFVWGALHTFLDGIETDNIQSYTTLDLQLAGDLRLNNNPGAYGQVLTSNGPGFAPTWENGGGGGGSVDAVDPGDGISVDSTDPHIPVVSVDESFSFLWTATHRWTDNDEVQLGTGGDLRLYHNGTNSIIENDTGSLVFDLTGQVTMSATGTAVIWTPTSATIFRAPNATSDAQMAFEADSGFNARLLFRTRSSVNRWLVSKNVTSETGSNAGSNFDIEPRADDGSSLGVALRIIRSTSNVLLLKDNQELQLGASQDLRLTHDGTDSIIRNDTGIFKLNYSTNGALWFNSSRAFGIGGANYGATGQVLMSKGSSAVPEWATIPDLTGTTLSAEILADSPSGYWKMDEASGNFADSSGNSRTLTAGGSITYRHSCFVPSEPTTAYASFASGAGAVASGTFSMAPLTGDYTIEGVFVGQTYATNPTVIFGMGGSGETEAANVQTSFRIDTNSRMAQFWESGAGVDTTAATIIEVLEGKAYHYACVKDGTANTVTYYLNGLKVSTVSYTNDPSGGTGTMETGIGTVSTVTSNGMQIAHVAFYNGTKLSDARIVAHARAAGLFGA